MDVVCLKASLQCSLPIACTPKFLILPELSGPDFNFNVESGKGDIPERKQKGCGRDHMFESVVHMIPLKKLLLGVSIQFC